MDSGFHRNSAEEVTKFFNIKKITADGDSKWYSNRQVQRAHVCESKNILFYRYTQRRPLELMQTFPVFPRDS